MQITENLFVAYCQCPYKAFLKSKGEGRGSRAITN